MLHLNGCSQLALGGLGRVSRDLFLAMLKEVETASDAILMPTSISHQAVTSCHGDGKLRVDSDDGLEPSHWKRPLLPCCVALLAPCARVLSNVQVSRDTMWLSRVRVTVTVMDASPCLGLSLEFVSPTGIRVRVSA